MDAETINKRIHEWLGKCWHEADTNPDPSFKNICDKCGWNCNWEDMSFPDYTTDLNAVREAELKCIEEFGWDKHEVALIQAHYRATKGDTKQGWYSVASAEIRAQAVCDVLEGRYEL